MPKFRKKPIVIEAIQFTGDNVSEIWDAFGAADIYGPTEENPDSLVIDTIEGKMKAGVGWWVVKGIEDEFYPCKPEVFAATYEAVDEFGEAA